MTDRTPLSKRMRFEVFKRDGFQCQYCGRTPPAVILECDHINPVALGGDNDPSNLITSCRECNQGKAAVPLTDKAPSLQSSIIDTQERQEQLREYGKLLAKIEKRQSIEIQEICQIFESTYPYKTLDDRFKLSTVKRFLEKLPFVQVKEAMKIACAKMNQFGVYQKADNTIKYFCGICWKRIKEPNRD